MQKSSNVISISSRRKLVSAQVKRERKDFRIILAIITTILAVLAAANLR